MMGVKMKSTRWTVTVALAAALVVFAACKAESPTEPRGNPPGGGTPPPTAASITLTVSNATPLVSSTTNVTAMVTQNGAAVPDGTAVEFSTTLGTFTSSGTTTVIKTTVGGAATATLTSADAGDAVVTARVNNISKNVTVKFKLEGGGPSGVTITSFAPATSNPEGGVVVTIQGTNFVAPVRVLFGDKEATVVSVTSTQIQAVAPKVDLGASEQKRDVPIIVISQAGTSNEARATSSTNFSYVLQVLTPVVYSVSPSTGPNEGNTRISIVGEGFQAPTKVFFGTGGSAGGSLTDQVEVQVIQVNFGQIIAMTPPALGLATQLRDKQVAIRILNVNTNKDVVVANAFRYGPAMQITAVGPTEGPIGGGTQVKISGWGFDDPVAVSIGGVAAQPIRVSGTEIVAVTSPLLTQGCSDFAGDVVVTNVEDGATSPPPAPKFTYRALKPSITNVVPTSATPGSVISITVANGLPGNVRFTIGGKTIIPGAPTISGNLATFPVTLPTNVTFSEQTCTSTSGLSGNQYVPTDLDVAFENTTTGCTDQLTGAITVNPTDTSCRVAPSLVPSTTAISFGDVAVGTSPSPTQTFTVSNPGSTNLIISSAAAGGDFSVTAPSAFPITVAPGTSAGPFTVTFTPSSTGAKTGTVTFGSNAATQPTIALTGTGV